MRKILHMNLRMSWEFYIDESKSYQIHIAMGVYKIEDITIPVSVMCDRANMALRTIKDNFMEKVAYYDEYMRENVLKEQILAGEIPRAIENGEIKIYLQGICDAKGDVLGAEALVRWEHPSKGILPAGGFIGALEENGMIVMLDQYVWKCACQQLKKWKEEGNDRLFISVNVSAKDFDAMDV